MPFHLLSEDVSSQEDVSEMVKNGGKVKCSFWQFKNALTGRQGVARRRKMSHLKAMVMYFNRKKFQPA
jgi:hypothetical protein